MLWNIPGLLLLMLLVINGALVVFAHYHKCNPLSMKRIGKYEEVAKVHFQMAFYSEVYFGIKLKLLLEKLQHKFFQGVLVWSQFRVSEIFL